MLYKILNKQCNKKYRKCTRLLSSAKSGPILNDFRIIVDWQHYHVWKSLISYSNKHIIMTIPTYLSNFYVTWVVSLWSEISETGYGCKIVLVASMEPNNLNLCCFMWVITIWRHRFITNTHLSTVVKYLKQIVPHFYWGINILKFEFGCPDQIFYDAIASMPFILFFHLAILKFFTFQIFEMGFLGFIQVWIIKYLMQMTW